MSLEFLPYKNGMSKIDEGVIMTRIALGSDHRGGKIAESLLRRIWFCNQIAPQDVIDNQSLLSYHENQIDIESPFIGVIAFDSIKSSDPLRYLGSNQEIILSRDEIQMNEDYNGTNGNSAMFYADYPDIASIVAQKVSQKEVDLGILVCGTGIGMNIVANKYPDVRAAFCHSELTAELSRMHNDANILCLSGEMIGESTAVSIVLRWLQTEYAGGRHQIRIEKIRAIEKKTGL